MSSRSTEWQKFGNDRTVLTCLRGDNLSSREVGTRRDGLQLDSAASPLEARRGSGDAPFHSQTADIANPFPKYLIPKRLELSMDYKPIYYFPCPCPTLHVVTEATNTTHHVYSLRAFRKDFGEESPPSPWDGILDCQ